MRQTSLDKRNNFVAMVISVRPTTTVTKSEFKTTMMNNKILITRARSRHESGFRIRIYSCQNSEFRIQNSNLQITELRIQNSEL